MTTLKYKCIDVVREEYGLDPDDNRVSFDEDMEKQRENFFKSSTVLDEKNGKGTILYKDAEDDYRLIPDCYPYVDMLEFVIKSMPKVKTEILKKGAGDADFVDNT